jgi:hypothetical protein
MNMLSPQELLAKFEKCLQSKKEGKTSKSHEEFSLLLNDLNARATSNTISSEYICVAMHKFYNKQTRHGVFQGCTLCRNIKRALMSEFNIVVRNNGAEAIIGAEHALKKKIRECKAIYKTRHLNQVPELKNICIEYLVKHSDLFKKKNVRLPQQLETELNLRIKYS